MSWKATGYVKELRQGLSVTDKFVLLILAEYHQTDSGSAWPSITTLATDCLMTPRAIQQILRRLQDNHFILKVSGCGRGNVSGYEILGLIKHEPNSTNGRAPFKRKGEAKGEPGGSAIRNEPLEPISNNPLTPFCEKCRGTGSRKIRVDATIYCECPTGESLRRAEKHLHFAKSVGA